MPPEPFPLVLLVDDFADALEMYSLYLTYVGHRVLAATSGPEAIALATVHVPDVVLLDLEMSGMHGTEAMHRMRELPALAGVPIVALTSHAFGTAHMHALLAGFDEVITKPCSPADLAAAVQRLVRAGRAGADA